MTKNHGTILLVEDDHNDQILIKNALRANGVTGPIQTVDDGAEAIAYMKGEGNYSDRAKYAYPNFMITDLKMPRCDGFEVLLYLKRNPEWAIPIVVLTASKDPDDIKKAYMLGASSYHVKPADYQGLRFLLKILHDYWMTCEVPEVDITGKQLKTPSQGRLGERFPQSL
jgi:CheY-like chemotaxis protein